MSIAGETSGGSDLLNKRLSSSLRPARAGFVRVALMAALAVMPFANTPVSAEGWGRAWVGEYGALALAQIGAVSNFQNSAAAHPPAASGGHQVSDPVFADANPPFFENESRVFDSQSRPGLRNLRLWVGSGQHAAERAPLHPHHHVTAQTLSQDPPAFGIGFQLPLGETVDLSGSLLRSENSNRPDGVDGATNRITLTAAFRF